jgi:ABC-type ATPase with predicted acetyltransferase domain
MTAKRKIEVFSAGCPVCEETIEEIKKAACPSCDVTVLDIKDIKVTKRAEAFSLRMRMRSRY